MSAGERKVALVHLGCAKNLVDSEHMLGILASGGSAITTDTDEADVLVINTCAFIGPAKKESVDRILEGERWKAERPGRRLIVAGCLAERYAADLKREIPAIDAVVGTGQVGRIASAVEGGGRLELPGRRLPSYLPDHTTPRLVATLPHSVYLKISEGCDHTCSFCIIPKLRGAHRSRSIASLVAEAEMLAAQGARELNLVAQDSTSYGEDIGIRDGLSQLVPALAAVADVAWLRLHYAYPTRLTPGFIETLAREPKLVKYLDMPLQHASRPVLKVMRRGGDGESHLRLLERVRERVPDVAVRTTFIVGFPNETERRFEELVRFVERAELDHVGVFTYSHEEGTAAGELRDRVPERTKAERRRALMETQRKVVRRKQRRLIGTRQRVLIDSVAADGSARARLASQAYEVDGQVHVAAAAGAAPGSFIEVVIARAKGHDLVAEPAPAA